METLKFPQIKWKKKTQATKQPISYLENCIVFYTMQVNGDQHSTEVELSLHGRQWSSFSSQNYLTSVASGIMRLGN